MIFEKTRFRKRKSSIFDVSLRMRLHTWYNNAIAQMSATRIFARGANRGFFAIRTNIYTCVQTRASRAFVRACMHACASVCTSVCLTDVKADPGLRVWEPPASLCFSHQCRKIPVGGSFFTTFVDAVEHHRGYRRRKEVKSREDLILRKEDVLARKRDLRKRVSREVLKIDDWFRYIIKTRLRSTFFLQINGDARAHLSKEFLN